MRGMKQMSELKIITNNQRRELLYYWELHQKEKDEFDWIEDGTKESYIFFRYRGNI